MLSEFCIIRSTLTSSNIFSFKTSNNEKFFLWMFPPSFLLLLNITLSAFIKRVALSWVMIWETVAGKKTAPTQMILPTKGYKSFFYETLVDNRKRTPVQSCSEYFKVEKPIFIYHEGFLLVLGHSSSLVLLLTACSMTLLSPFLLHISWSPEVRCFQSLC